MPSDTAAASPRHDWTLAQVMGLFSLPFNDLLWQAHGVHRAHFPANQVQVSTLLSIKTGACPEDCKYCPQSVRYHTEVETEQLMDTASVVAAARQAKAAGASRFCMGAAWRSLKDRDVTRICQMVEAVKALGLETCMTLGMISEDQAQQLKQAGLDYYNHNIDTSPEYYEQVISTRRFNDRLQTLQHVRAAGLSVCCGGIVGMGEQTEDRAGMLLTLANLPQQPQSVPINQLVQVPGTPLHGQQSLDPLEFVRTIACARVMLPRSVVRLSAGRSDMSDELQALCFFAGANSIFYGDKLLTTDNPQADRDRALMQRLGLEPSQQPANASHLQG